jgi:hypothetical protein
MREQADKQGDPRETVGCAKLQQELSALVGVTPYDRIGMSIPQIRSTYGHGSDGSRGCCARRRIAASCAPRTHFTAPRVKPRAMYLCTTIPPMITGAVMSVAPAMTFGQGTM